MPYHHGSSGRRIDGGDHGGLLIGERRRGVSVTLAWQRDRHGPVAVRLERGNNVVPHGPVEPQARDQQDVHDRLSFRSWLGPPWGRRASQRCRTVDAIPEDRIPYLDCSP
jgi:hypothetical protein